MNNSSSNGDSADSEDYRLYADLAEKIARLMDAGEIVDTEQLVQQCPPDKADQVRKIVPSLVALYGLGYRHDTPVASDGEHIGAIGDYRILHEIGRGGMGVVYQAEQISLTRQVALKILPYAAVLNPNQLQRFKNEARAAAVLKHPHIVDVHNVGSDRGVYFFAMSFIDGRSLDDVVKQLQQLCDQNSVGLSDSVDQLIRGEAAETIVRQPTSDSARDSTQPRGRNPSATRPSQHSSVKYHRSIAALAADVADALNHAHQQGVIHRDIKPSNLLLDGHGEVWVTDFGLAQIKGDPGLTMTGNLVGTLRYMSPEQVLAKRVPIDHRTDIYSLGVTLYELLTLTPAIPYTSQTEILRSISFDEPQSPHKIDPTIPADLETIVLKAIEKNPDDRYADCGELAADLKRFLNNQPIQARRPSLTTKITKWGRRHPGVVVMTFILLFTGVLGSLGYALTVQKYANRLEINEQILKASQEKLVDQNELANRYRSQAEQNRDLLAYIVSIKSGDQRTQQLVEKRLQLPTDDIDNVRAFLNNDDSLKKASQNISAIIDTLAALDVADDKSNDYGKIKSSELQLRLARLNLEIGLLSRANKQFDAAVDILEELANERPTDLTIKQKLIATRNDYALALDANGRPFEATRHLKAAVRDARKLVESDKNNLAFQYQLVVTKKNLAVNLFGKLSDASAAEAIYVETMPVIDKLVATASSNSRYLELAAAAKTNLADVYRARNSLDKASTFARSAIDICMKTISDKELKSNERMHVILGQSLFTQAKIYEDQKLPEEASEYYRKAVEGLQKSMLQYPHNTTLMWETAAAQDNLGSFLLRQGDVEQAVVHFNRSVETYKKLASRSPESNKGLARMARSYTTFAEVLEEQGAIAQALQHRLSAVELKQQILQQNPGSAEYRHNLAAEKINTIGLHMKLGKSAEALRQVDDAIRLQRRNVQESPDVLEFQLSLARSLINRGMLQKQTGESDAALTSVGESLRMLELLARTHAANAELQALQAAALNVLN